MATSIPQKPPPPPPKVETARPDAGKSATASKPEAAAKPASTQSASAPAKSDPARLRMADGFETASARPQTSSGGSSFTPAQASALRPTNDAFQQMNTRMADASTRLSALDNLGSRFPSNDFGTLSRGQAGAAGGVADRTSLGLGRPEAGAAGGVADRPSMGLGNMPRAGAAGGVADYFPSGGSQRGVNALGNDQDLNSFLSSLGSGSGGLFQPGTEPLITFQPPGNGNHGGWWGSGDFGLQNSGGGGAAGGVADRWGREN